MLDIIGTIIIYCLLIGAIIYGCWEAYWYIRQERMDNEVKISRIKEELDMIEGGKNV